MEGPSNIFFPQVAVGGGYTSTFTITNPTPSTATGTLRLWDENGSAWNISLTDDISGSQFSVSIPAMGSIRLITSGTGEIKTGWAALESSAGLQAVETFDYRPGSVLQDSVGVIGAPSGKRFVLPVDISSTSDTGFAVINAVELNVSINITLKDESGNTYAALLDPRLNPLPAANYLCMFVSEIFPSLQSGSFKGTLSIEVVGSGDIAVMGLSYKEGQSSSIPVVALNSP